MGQRFAKLASAAVLLLAGLTAYCSPVATPALQLWYWHHSNLTNNQALLSSKALIDRAAQCGYTGVAFWDNSFFLRSDSFWPPANVERLREAMQYATEKGLRVMALGAPFGWSNPALVANGNLAEGQRVIGASFRVDRSGKELDFLNTLEPLKNSGFEEGRAGWFDTGDAAIGISHVAHDGKNSAAIVDTPANARFRQRISLTPWRQYHLSLWFKSEKFRGPAAVEVLDFWHRKQNRFYTEIAASGTHEWTKLDYMFDSRDTSWAYLYFGVWGQSSGVLWFDDVQLEETAPVYVVRRPGAPLRVYDPNDPRIVYREGRDFNPVSDPVLGAAKAVFRDVYHPPVRVSLPSGTRLRAGQTVAMDFYAVFPIPQDEQAGMCLTEPAVFRWLNQNASALKAIMPLGGEVLLSYDEIRQANSCASCRAKQMSAGELLAWNVQKTTGLYQTIMPYAKLYVWSDMFDPNHNARNHYYYVEGDLAESWKGLPSQVGVLNWNHGHLRTSLEWFAGVDRHQPTPHHQIIAGYYDGGKGANAAEDFAVARGIPGIQGIMYVSWRDDYTQLEAFASSAAKAWKSYSASIAGPDR